MRIDELNNIHHGRRAFLVGNGPSLASMDLGPIENDVTFGCNGIYKPPPKMDGWKPTYHLVQDDRVAINNADEINRYRGVVKFFPEDLSSILDGDLYYNLVRDVSPFPRFSLDPSVEVFGGRSVLFSALQFAAYMGCNPIYLIGCDHSFNLSVYGKDGRVVGPDKNHFRADYSKIGEKLNPVSRFTLDQVDQAFAFARKTLEASGIRVLNASTETKLTALDRVDYVKVA